MTTRSPQARTSAFALVLLFLLMSAITARAADTTRLLDVFVNGQPTHLVVELMDRDGKLLVRADDIAELGLSPGAARTEKGAQLVALQDIPGLTFTIDQQRQELHVTASDAALKMQDLDSGARTAAPGPIGNAGFGAVLNYDLVASRIDKATLAGGTFDARSFSPWGVADTSWIAGSGLTSGPARRLDSTASYQDPANLRRWTMGDTISGGLDWSRPYRIGGIQIASNFALRPDLVTFPVPTLSGRANVPSTMDLFVDGVRTLSRDVAPGPFQLQQTPLITGAGNLSMVVRDPTGHESVQTFSFYGSTSLLARGLTSYSGEAGWLRQDYGLVGDAYTQPAASGTARRGLTDWLTLEAHGEGSGHVVMGGVGSVASLFGLGLANVSLAASTPSSADGASRKRGLQYSIGVERVGRRFSLAASATRTLGSFSDVSTTASNTPPSRLYRLETGLALGRFGNLNAAYVVQKGGYAASSLLGSPSNARIVSASYSRPLSNTIQFYSTGYRDIENHSLSAEIGIVIPLGRRRSASTSSGLQDDHLVATVQVQQTAFKPGDVGWNVIASQGGTSRQSGQASYVSSLGTGSAEVDHVSGQTGVQGEFVGAVVAMPGGAFMANRVNDSFAVVDTNGLAGVTVERENRPIGRTNASGLLLIPDLNGWQKNKISLDPADLPPDADIGSLEQNIVPRERSGVRVPFNISRGHSALIRLVDEAGKPIRAGAIAILDGSNQTSPVGYDGELFLTGLSNRNHVVVDLPNGRCAAEIPFASKKNELPVLGPIICKKVAA